MDTTQAVPTRYELAQAKNHLLSDFLFTLNISGALFFGGLVFVLKNWDLPKPTNDSTYLCLRSMYRVIDFLGLQSQNSVVTNTVRREFPTRSEQLGAEIFVIVTWLGLAAAAIVVLWLWRNTRVNLGPAAPTILLFAAPGCYLYVSWLTWKWPYEPVVRAGSFFTESLPFAVFLTEMICLGLLLFFCRLRRKSLPTWMKVSVITLHYIFWILVLWSETHALLFPIYARGLILVLLPVSTLIYLLRKDRLTFFLKTRPTTRSWVLAAVILVVTGAVWRPARNVEISHPKNLDSVAIELSRGPCYGACPAYTITLQGDGQVQYVSQPGYSRIQTKKSGTIEKENVTRILEMLDRVDFMTLEGRAFFWGFDSPSVGVRTSVDGKTKQVASDTRFVGAPKGRQSRFVQATREIDAILASSTWRKCEGDCESSGSSR
jgi:hypothetical protein